MKIIFSPAKTMNTKLDTFDLQDELLFKDQSLKLFKQLKKYTKDDLARIMKISEKIADEVYAYYQNFSALAPRFTAIFLYNGLAYRQLHVSAYTQDQLDYLNNHLRILSAMYGVLTPFTSIWPYRLDFTLPFKDLNLKKLWIKKIQSQFKDEDFILNLASEEFSQLLSPHNMHTVYFFDEKNGKRRVNAAEAKKARAKALEYCVMNTIEVLDDIKNIQIQEYTCVSSDQVQTTFIRKR